MKLYATSRIGRRLGERFFFKPERDSSPKSAMVRRPYPPGMHGKRRRRGISEFGAELQEKQKVRHLYGITDTMLKRRVRASKGVRGKTRTQSLLEMLERRLDNVVYRTGLAPSRRMARHLVSYGHFSLNGKPVRSPSRLVRPGERIAVRDASRDKPPFSGLAVRLKQHSAPAWLKVEPEELAGTMARLPAEEDQLLSQNLSRVIEYYSR